VRTISRQAAFVAIVLMLGLSNASRNKFHRSRRSSSFPTTALPRSSTCGSRPELFRCGSERGPISTFIRNDRGTV
jgi:hypothetical protein